MIYWVKVILLDIILVLVTDILGIMCLPLDILIGVLSVLIVQYIDNFKKKEEDE